MGMVFEGRPSDSPYVDMIWRVHTESEAFPVCPADGRWNLLLTKRGSRVHVSVEGPLTKAKPKSHAQDMEWLVIKFKLGSFLPQIIIHNLLNTESVLPTGAHNSFWLNGSIWQYPDFENVETFVNRLVRDEALAHDPLVTAALQGQSLPVSSRTVRRRFLRATGLTPGLIHQIDRAQHAMSLLERGTPILDTVYQAGYADQPHLTRSMRRFVGQSPAQIAQASQPG